MIQRHLRNAGMACAILMLGFTAPCARSQGAFSLDDIHYWVGEGTNRAAVLIDFDFRGRQAGLSNSIAYGIRWNGEMTQLSALRAIAREDRRLHFSAYTSWGAELPESFGYDMDGDGGVFDLKKANKTDSDDIVESCNSDFGWNFFWATAEKHGATFSQDFSFCDKGVAKAIMITNGYFGIMFLPWRDSMGNPVGSYDENGRPLPFEYPETGDWIDFTPSFPVAAESPYGYKMIRYRSEPDPSFVNGYTNSLAVLGRPSAWGDLDQYPEAGVAPITPFIPAASRSQLVRLCDIYDSLNELVEMGSIDIAFDHPVVDDPNNPWGLDFIVFGNAFYTGTGMSNLTGREDPATVVVGVPPEEYDGLLAAEPAEVSVSQDGVRWFTFSEGPFTDSFAPTMGFRYDPANADPNLFNGNAWWGAPADPTYPVPPSASGAIGVGTTLAQMASWYGDSAGGTAFDIGALALPATYNGRKWFKYVRIVNKTPLDDTTAACEIDAVSDVYPDTPYGLYAKERYAWTELPTYGAKTAVAANGRQNFVNFSLGESPDASLRISGFEIRDGRAMFSFKVWKRDWTLAALQESGVELTVRASGRLSPTGITGSPFGWPRFDGVAANADGSMTATVSVPAPATTNAFFRLGLSAKDQVTP